MDKRDLSERDIERHQSAELSYMDEGVQLCELARSVQSLFAKQEPREKRRLLNFVCTASAVVSDNRRPKRPRSLPDGSPRSLSISNCIYLDRRE
jgi:hypothetical protein